MGYGTIPKTINVDGVTIEKNAEGEIQIKGGAVSTDMLADYAVSKNKIGYVYTYIDSTLNEDVMYQDTNRYISSQTTYETVATYDIFENVFSSQKVKGSIEYGMATGSSTEDSYVRVLKNGVQVFEASKTGDFNFTKEEFDILDVSNGDIIEIQLKQVDSGSVDCRNFTIYGSTKLSGNNPFN